MLIKVTASMWHGWQDFLADEILEGLEVEGIKEEPAAPVIRRETALNLFSSPIIDELADLDVMSKTPIEAMEILFRLSKEAKEGR